MRLLLLSNSRATPAGAYLARALAEIGDFLGRSRGGGVRALRRGHLPLQRPYLHRVAARLREARPLGGVAPRGDPAEVLRREADTIVVGGGNTFRLLEILQRSELLPRIRKRIKEGTPFIGWSAGSNLACPTIRTTNDMPIVQPVTLEAMGLIPFQINPHFTDEVLPNYGGESRAERLREFLALNPKVAVAGLREGGWIRREHGGQLRLGGTVPMTLFRAGQEPAEFAPGADLAFLLQGATPSGSHRAIG